MFKQNKAEMGVGTLIVFIAMLLVAAVAAGVLIQTISSLQEKSFSTGQQAKSQISTNAQTIEVSATDGRNGTVTNFQQLMKLSPGSDAIKLDQIIFTFNTKDATSTLKYRGAASICEKNNVDGYNTWNSEAIDGVINKTLNVITLAEDLDDDGADDYLYIDAGGDNLVFSLSSAGDINIAITNVNAAPVNVSLASTAIANATDTFAYVEISGDSNTTTNEEIPEGYVTVTPYNEGQGYFSAIYEQQGTNWIDGNMQRGDVIRLCYESSEAVGEDTEVRLNFIPKIGTATLTMFVTPEVISTERVYLYP